MKRPFLALVASLFLALPISHAFDDVAHDDLYGPALHSLQAEGKIKGYKDGTFKPNNRMNRAEFVTMLVKAVYGEPGSEYATSCFTDITSKTWFAPYVCFLKDKGYIKGYRDGSFGGATEINLAEGSKLLNQVFSLTPREAKKGEAWFIPYLEELERHKAMPPTFQYIGQPLKRGEVGEVIWRLANKDMKQASVKLASLSSKPCEPFYEHIPGFTIDTNKVRETWISWYNSERARIGKPLLSRDPRLDISSISWSKTAKQRGYIDHKRPGTKAYYDYNKILSWFKDSFGYTFPQKGRAGYGESIAYNYFSCNDSECTDELISAIKHSYNFFLNERGKAYRPHYDMMINGNYNKIGLGIVIDPERKRYWLTTHLATEVVSKGLPYCQGA